MAKNALQFYDKFGTKYDWLISEKRYDEDLAFFKNICKKHSVKSILDCSCGTGKHVTRLSQAGFDVVGSDISAQMIELARQNANRSRIRATFVKADFKELPRVFDRKFDCVISWGNSLNHELEERGILSALRSMYRILRERGVVIIQIRNLPKWVRKGKRIFPMHYHKESNGDRKIFIYLLDFHKTRVRFNVLSLLESNGRPHFETDSVDYRIMSGQKLRKIVAEAGFGEIKVYGDTAFSSFDDKNSEDIIVVGTRWP